MMFEHSRKLVNLLVDVEEWGQVTLLNMLTRYARTQFIDPNIGLDFPCEVGHNFVFLLIGGKINLSSFNLSLTMGTSYPP